MPALNDYLREYARQNHKKGIAKTLGAIPETGNGEVAGYYSLSMGGIEFESLPERYRRGLPRSPLTAVRRGKLAVTQSMQGRILGEKLLMDALNKAVWLSQDIGVFAGTVDARGVASKGVLSEIRLTAIREQGAFTVYDNPTDTVSL